MTLLHLVLFKWKADVDSATVDALIADLNKLQTLIPFVKSSRAGANVSPARAKGFTHALTVELDDEAALQAYSDHPAHMDVLKTILELKDDVIAIDYYV
ncbi:stress responsive alpha-beta barrel domain-containing protein [Ramicandelaber brevisporus]|nr:stress responsive alpha-beta barrel domain-containing protein [Ramicandelaber brevisporus]